MVAGVGGAADSRAAYGTLINLVLGGRDHVISSDVIRRDEMDQLVDTLSTISTLKTFGLTKTYECLYISEDGRTLEDSMDLTEMMLEGLYQVLAQLSENSGKSRSHMQLSSTYTRHSATRKMVRSMGRADIYICLQAGSMRCQSSLSDDRQAVLIRP